MNKKSKSETELTVYTVTAEVTISVSTRVRATSEKEALKIAKSRPLMQLCGHCASRCDGDYEEWTVGDLDGEPRNLEVD